MVASTVRPVLVGEATSTQARSSQKLVFEAVDLSKIYAEGAPNELVALRNVSLEIREGEFVCLVGPSGCGKTTLLNIFAGLLGASHGSARFEGREIRGPNTATGYMAQQDNLLPWRTLHRNVELSLELQGVPRAERKQRVAAALAKVGLEGRGDLFPSQLSGGMRKRGALARTLVYDPRTLLMDEPFGAIDAQLKMALQVQLLQICESSKTTVVFVTHDLEEALLLGDRVVVFAANPGRIVHIEEVPFPRPRSIFDLRASPEFWDMWKRLWTFIGTEGEEVSDHG